MSVVLGPGPSPDGFYDALIDDDPEELYETAPCGYVSTTPSGTIVKANRTFLQWTGFSADELFHRRRFQTLLPVGDRIFWETHLAPTLLMQGSAREVAVDVVTVTGERLPILLNAALKSSPAGEPLAVRIALFDARERRSYERELVAARQAALQAAREARSLAETLQRTLLPLTPPTIGGLDVGAAYRPAGDGSVIGGDFYDVFEIASDVWGIVLGDVCGKGAAAAVTTALSRYTVRAEAVRSASPSVVLHALHDALERDDGRSFCTALYGRLEPEGTHHRIDLAAGGHQLPLLVSADGTIREVGVAGSLLGMLGPPRLHDERVELHPGDALVLSTDGVVEARAGEEFFGADRLRDLVVDRRADDAQGLADAVAGAAIGFQHGDTRDDIAVLVVKSPAGTD